MVIMVIIGRKIRNQLLVDIRQSKSRAILKINFYQRCLDLNSSTELYMKMILTLLRRIVGNGVVVNLVFVIKRTEGRLVFRVTWLPSVNIDMF